MPPVIPVIIGAAVVAGAEALGASVIVASILGAAAAGLATTVLSGRPKQTASTAGQNTAVQASGRTVTIREPASPWQIIYGQVRVGGVLTFVEESSDKQYLHLILTLAGHVCQEIGDIYFNDELLELDGSGDVVGSPSTYAGYARVIKSLGSEGGQPFSQLVSESNGIWTNAHRQSGRAKIYVRLKANPEVYPAGVPNITAVVKGRKVFDPRTGTSAYSANPALCICDYLTNSSFGMGLVYATEIDESTLIDSADACEALVGSPTPDSSYEANGAVSASQNPKEIVESLLTAMAGWAVNVGGVWHIFSGTYDAPTVTLDESEFAGPITVTSLVSRRDNCNAVSGMFVDPNQSYQPVNFPPIISSSYAAEDNNETVWKDVDLTAFVTSSAQAQRLAKIELLRTRQGLSLTANFKLSAYRAMTGRTVALSFDRYGWSSKEFEVLGSQFAVNEDGSLGVQLSLRETASAIYDWDTSEEQALDLAPNTNLPDPFSVASPGAPSVVEAIYDTRDGRGRAIKAIVTSGTTDYSTVFMQVAYKMNADSTWIELPPTYVTSLSITQDVYDLAPGYWDFRVRGQNSLGKKSGWSSTTTKNLSGIGTEPDPPQVKGAQLSSGVIIISIQKHPESDVRVGGRIIVRHTEAFVDPDWNETFSIGDPDGYPGDSTLLILPLKPGTYMLKAEDALGQQSTTATLISTKQSFLFQLNSAGDITEDSSFAGTHSSTMTTGGVLELAELSGEQAVETDGTYGFAGSFDFGAVTRVRVTGEIQGVAVNVYDTIDSRAELMDAWLDFDGAVTGGVADAWIETRETDDDVSVGGSPDTNWSEWKRMDSGDFECWGMEFRCRITSTDSTYNEVIDTLRVHAEEIP